MARLLGDKGGGHAPLAASRMARFARHQGAISRPAPLFFGTPLRRA